MNQETIEIVRKEFPELNAYQSEEISFQSASGAIILDEAWPHLGQNPPAILRIVTEDAQGSREGRKWIGQIPNRLESAD
jgi:hypothetical protein